MQRTFVLRHLSRDKSNTDDPQVPTEMGELEAFMMGVKLRRQFGVQAFSKVISSPQPRAHRTATLVVAGVHGYHGSAEPVVIELRDGLNDFSSDPRLTPALKNQIRATKGTTDIESEQAIFLAGGEVETLRMTKLDEAFHVINGLFSVDGDSLVTLHGATVDGLISAFSTLLGDKDTKHGMRAFGRMIDKCEGFVLTRVQAGAHLSIEKIERPAWLNAVACLIGGGGD